MKILLNIFKSTLVLVGIFFVFSLWISDTVFCQEETRTVSRTIEVNQDPYFTLMNKYGDVDVTGWDKDIISIEALIKVKGPNPKEMMDRIDVKIQESRTNVLIETIYNLEEGKKRILSFNVNYLIKIPKNSRSRIDNQFGFVKLNQISGDLEVSNMFGLINLTRCLGKNEITGKFCTVNLNEIGGNSKIENENGTIKVDNVSGDIRIRNSFGDCTIRAVKGNLEINNKNGGIDIHEISGRADIQNQFGNVKAANINGIIELSSRNSDIDVTNVEGGRISNSFGGIRIENANGKTGLSITNNNGKVIVHGCNSNLILRNSFDYIELLDINGRVDVYSNNSSMRVESIKGDTKIENSFGRVEIVGSEGDVNVRNNAGDVELRSIQRVGKTYNIETEFGSIRVDFPANLSAQLSAESWFGNISSDFPLEIKKSSNLTTANGKIGDGSTFVKLLTRNASISINKSGRNTGVEPEQKKSINESKEIKKEPAPVKPSSSSNGSSTFSNRNSDKITYTIRKGDQVISIARKFNVKVSDLRRWNHFPKKVGEKIVIYKNERSRDSDIIR